MFIELGREALLVLSALERDWKRERKHVEAAAQVRAVRLSGNVQIAKQIIPPVPVLDVKVEPHRREPQRLAKTLGPEKDGMWVLF